MFASFSARARLRGGIAKEGVNAISDLIDDREFGFGSKERERESRGGIE